MDRTVSSDRRGRGPGAGSIVNPVSGERIVIRPRAAETGSTLLAWELFLDPGGRVPSAHAHPHQEERFVVLDGRMRFRVGGRRVTLGPGGAVVVPPGVTHHFANGGAGVAHLAVETGPALDTEAMFVAAAALARHQHAMGRRVPRLVDLSVFMHRFRREVRSPHLRRVLGAVTTVVALWVTWRAKRDQRQDM
jgi:mannose-6-phosphate isomerase-like protein (cupin superfamily)